MEISFYPKSSEEYIQSSIIVYTPPQGKKGSAYGT